MMRPILLALLLATGTAAASGPAIVATHTSEAGETVDQFVARIAPSAERITRKSAAEVCGEVEARGSEYRLTLYTTNVKDACDYLRKPDGDWTYTGESFHTHVIGAAPRFSPSDYDHPGYMARDGLILHHAGRGTERRVARHR